MLLIRLIIEIVHFCENSCFHPKRLRHLHSSTLISNITTHRALCLRSRSTKPGTLLGLKRSPLRRETNDSNIAKSSLAMGVNRIRVLPFHRLRRDILIPKRHFALTIYFNFRIKAELTRMCRVLLRSNLRAGEPTPRHEPGNCLLLSFGTTASTYGELSGARTILTLDIFYFSVVYKGTPTESPPRSTEVLFVSPQPIYDSRGDSQCETDSTTFYTFVRQRDDA